MWLESFIQLNGSRKSRRVLMKLQKTCRRDGRLAREDESSQIVEMERTGCFFNVLSCLSNRGISANRQLFFLTLLLRARGLSRSGSLLPKFMNLGLAPRSYDQELLQHMTRETTKSRLLHYSFLNININGFTFCLLFLTSGRTFHLNACVAESQSKKHT